VSQPFKTAIMGFLFLCVVMFGPGSALAGNMFRDQAFTVTHINLGGGVFATTNYVFTATEGPGSIVVKCFNDQFQRVGPAAGVNVALSATGQVAQHTPTTLGVASDPLFTGSGWCWANTIGSSNDFNSQVTIGVTTDLSVGGILNSSTTTSFSTTSGQGETSSLNGGVPIFTTAGGAAHYLVVVNPLPTTLTITLALFDLSGNPQGPILARTLNGRGMIVLQVPVAWGLATPPTSGSVRIQGPGAQGYMGWYLQLYPNGKIIFAAVGLDGDTVAQLPGAAAP
jgi:hypothetical protein